MRPDATLAAELVRRITDTTIDDDTRGLLRAAAEALDDIATRPVGLEGVAMAKAILAEHRTRRGAA